MGKKSSSANKKARYKAYKDLGKAKQNKAAKLKKHLKKHPNDEQSAEQRAARYPTIKKLLNKDIPLKHLWNKVP